MLTMLAIGGLALGGYIWFDQKFPKRPDKEYFKLTRPIMCGINHISSPMVKDDDQNGTTYEFQCRIHPDQAMINSDFHDMFTPEEYQIRQFLIRVNRENRIKWVYLGEDQYHCDKHEKSHCLAIPTLMGEELSREVLNDLMFLLLTYELSDTLRFDHWDNKHFVSKNETLVKEMRTIT